MLAQETPAGPERSPEPEWDIVERFEQMQREARESSDIERELREQVRQKLRLRDLPEEEKPAKEHAKEPAKEPDRPRRKADPTMEHRVWEMLQPEMKKPGLPLAFTLDPAKVALPWRIGLGVEPIESFPRSHLDIPKDSGVRVSMVASEGPAAKAGIKVDDILLSANGQNILSLLELRHLVLEAGSDGKAVVMELLHEGKRKTVSVKPRGPERPQPPKAETSDANLAPQPRLAEMARRLDQQQAEIEKLRQQVEELQEKINRE